MVKQFLKIAGVKTQAEFYKKYPTEEAFFRAHPEAMDLVNKKMAYGGMYAYQVGGQNKPDTSKIPMAADAPAYQHPLFDPSFSIDSWQNQVPAQVVPQAAAPSLVPYQGASIWDFLTAQGKAGDFQSRKALAKTLGMSGYRGTADQNMQMMEMIRQNPDVLKDYSDYSAPTPSVSKKSARKKQENINPADLKKYMAEEAERQAVANPYVTGRGAVDPNANWGFLPTDPNANWGFLPPTGKSSPKKKYAKKSDEYIANDPYFFADEGDNAFIRAIDAPFTWARNQGAKIVLDRDLVTAAKVAAMGAGVGLLNKAYKYFKPRYEPYNPNQLPGARPVAGQRALPAPPKALPAPSPRGWTMGEGSYRSPNFPFHKNGGDTGTYMNGIYFGAGGTYIPNPADSAYGVLPKYMYAQGGQNDIEDLYNAGYHLEYLAHGGPTFSNVTQYPHQGYVPAFDWMEFGGPTYSKHTGYPHQQYVPALDWMQQGGLVKGSVHDVSEDDVQSLINAGYKIEYL